MIGADSEIPELVLENDRHFLGIALFYGSGEPNARGMGFERNVEVMVAAKPVARGVGENPSHHRAQRVLNQKVVPDEVGAHEARSG